MILAVTLDTGGDVGKVLIYAAIAGAVASLVAELLLKRGKAAATGAFEIPGRTGARFYDLGSLAAVPLGVLAAAIAGLTLTPVDKVTDAAGKTSETMQLGDLIVVTSIAGLASTAFLTALAERFIAAMKATGLDTALRDAISALKELEADSAPQGAIAAEASGTQVAEHVEGRARQARRAAEDALRRLSGEGV